MQATKLLFSFILIPVIIFSQEKNNDPVTDVTKVTFLNPGFSYEKKTAKSKTLVVQAFMNTSFSVGYSSSLGNTSSISFDPALSLQYRFYYNYAKRKANGKRTEMNSLNYISPVFKTMLTTKRVSSNSSDYTLIIPNERRPYTTLGVVWGLQRNYKSRFSLDINIGIGYSFTTSDAINNMGNLIKVNLGQINPIGGLSLGFWLNKKRKNY